MREKEVVAFSALSNQWTLIPLRAQARGEAFRVGAQGVAVVTNQRVLGFGADTGTWASIRFRFR